MPMYQAAPRPVAPSVRMMSAQRRAPEVLIWLKHACIVEKPTPLQRGGHSIASQEVARKIACLLRKFVVGFEEAPLRLIAL